MPGPAPDRCRLFWAGHGQRSTVNSLPVIADTFGQPVIGLELATILLDAGADKTARCDHGKTPADYARERGHSSLAAMLD